MKGEISDVCIAQHGASYAPRLQTLAGGDGSFMWFTILGWTCPVARREWQGRRMDREAKCAPCPIISSSGPQSPGHRRDRGALFGGEIFCASFVPWNPWERLVLRAGKTVTLWSESGFSRTGWEGLVTHEKTRHT